MADETVDFQAEITLIKEAYAFDFVAIALTHSMLDSFVLRWRYAVGNSNERFKRIVLYNGKGIAGIVFKTGKPFLIKNTNEEIFDKDLFNYPIIVSESLKSLAALPLWRGHRVEGVLLVGFRKVDCMTKEILQSLENDLGQYFGSLYQKEMVLK